MYKIDWFVIAFKKLDPTPTSYRKTLTWKDMDKFSADTRTEMSCSKIVQWFIIYLQCIRLMIYICFKMNVIFRLRKLQLYNKIN